MMTRKDFQAVADVLRIRQGDDEALTIRDTVAEIARGLATVFIQDNPRFDKDKFYRACGLGEMADN